MNNKSKGKRLKNTIILGTITIAIGGVLVYGFSLWIDYLNQYDQVALYPTHLGDQEYYKIESETILVALDRGETEVFTKLNATPETPLFAKPVAWYQSDYLKVAGALHKFVWKESVETWSLYYMGFNTLCKDNFGGFDWGNVSYFKADSKMDRSTGYNYHGFQIIPEDGYVISGSNQYFPYKKPGWNSVDLENIIISAEDALRIADENGGQTARMSVQNQCSITVGLLRDFDWKVLMYKDGDSLLFSMEIDPYTGKIK